MAETVNRQWLIAARPEGMIKESDFRYNEAEVPEPGEGEVLVRTLMISVDPAMRGQMENRADYVAPLEIGDVMRAGGVGQVVQSNHPDFQEGDLVQGMTGMQDYFVTDNKANPLKKLREGIEIEDALSLFGGTEFTAYYGMIELGRPADGANVLVSGAAGAVGTVAGQFAKIKGARVVGIAGSDEKCRYIVDELGFDEAINYKTEDVPARIGELFPDGIDIYFDNVGGEILEAALDNITTGARVVLCGGITRYNPKDPGTELTGPKNYFNLVYRRARMEGFIIVDHVDKFGEWADIMSPWVAEGRLKSKVDIMDGFENTPEALIGLFKGANLGKQLVRFANPD